MKAITFVIILFFISTFAKSQKTDEPGSQYQQLKVAVSKAIIDQHLSNATSFAFSIKIEINPKSVPVRILYSDNTPKALTEKLNKILIAKNWKQMAPKGAAICIVPIFFAVKKLNGEYQVNSLSNLIHTEAFKFHNEDLFGGATIRSVAFMDPVVLETGNNENIP